MVGKRISRNVDESSGPRPFLYRGRWRGLHSSADRHPVVCASRTLFVRGGRTAPRLQGCRAVDAAGWCWSSRRRRTSDHDWRPTRHRHRIRHFRSEIALALNASFETLVENEAASPLRALNRPRHRTGGSPRRRRLRQPTPPAASQRPRLLSRSRGRSRLSQLPPHRQFGR